MGQGIGSSKGYSYCVQAAVVLTVAVAAVAPVAAQVGTTAECHAAQGCTVRAAATDVSAPVLDSTSGESRSNDDRNAVHDANAAVAVLLRKARRPDFNRNIYYKNKLEFSLEFGCLPVNIPFLFNFATGDPFQVDDPLHYVLVPIIASVHWQPDGLAGPLFLRGNWDLSASAAVTPIVKGPETHYEAFVIGIRRNFVPRNSRVAPYLEGRVGAGSEDARGPRGVYWGQGQDFAFTLMAGTGIRYNVSPRYAFWVGAHYMHISNLYMSEPRYLNWGINVTGPIIGFSMQIHAPRRTAVH